MTTACPSESDAILTCSSVCVCVCAEVCAAGGEPAAAVLRLHPAALRPAAPGLLARALVPDPWGHDHGSAAPVYVPAAAVSTVQQSRPLDMSVLLLLNEVMTMGLQLSATTVSTVQQSRPVCLVADPWGHDHGFAASLYLPAAAVSSV